MSKNRIHSHLDEIAWIGKLADLQEHQYRSSLLLTAVVELLQEKGILSLQEITDKACLLEQLDTATAGLNGSEAETETT
ncbi:hypothetical protein SAMN02799630_04140 [Paenibacillus sp. UNCCL117]|uniref:hypothetical protein n=1 Tax=unclassified Paenibacillus TaxID=185978 RepID=UPI000881CA9B|nr:MULTISPECIES: hypothetical protein [unclassified Paenibacillus]SDD85761.1 hypothetical protein SAMN04488602_114112 [Paenibacillus sp. cl123]SFW54309.1 hypothetical protein SAMN02799630_04140 [Paenibacillus sp. UNCCL117]